MDKRYSIAEARNQLPQLVHAAEGGRPVEITRRGKPVAVLVSTSEFERLQRARPDLWAAIAEFRRTHDVDRNGLEASDFRDLRDQSPGREFSW